MSGFTSIDLSKLPAPDVIKTVAFEELFEETRSEAIRVMPELAKYLVLESETATKILQVCAHLRMLDRLEFNDGARANMLALATGADLDGLAAFWGAERLVIQEADASVSPPIEELKESDDDFRKRTQLSLEGHTTAGPRGSYLYWALSASATIKDVDADAPVFGSADLAPEIMAQLPDDVIVLRVVDARGLDNPMPGDVAITVLSHEGQGEPSNEDLSAVEETLNNEDVRPLTDHVRGRGADILTYEIAGSLTLYPRSDRLAVFEAAMAAVEKYKEANHRLGHDITRAGIYAALYQEGVQNVVLTSPAADLVVANHQAAFCTSVDVSFGGYDV